MGTIYIMYGGVDKDGVHWSKVGYFDVRGTIDEKLDWLNKEGKWAARKRGGPFANLTSWSRVFELDGHEITYELEQDIHSFLKSQDEAEPGHIPELYHAKPSMLFDLFYKEFAVIRKLIPPNPHSEEGDTRGLIERPDP